jgi:hypothetical protein
MAVDAMRCQAGGGGTIGGRRVSARSTRRSHTSEDGQAEHEVQVLHGRARVAAFLEHGTQFDGGVHDDEQRQHGPMQEDGSAVVTLA